MPSRCQQGMTTARADEETFFATRPEYSAVREKCGTVCLARTLNSILVQHIQAVMPELRARVEEVLQQRVQELMGYGEPLTDGGTAARGAILLRLLHSYAESFARMLDGRSEQLPTNELAGGARIRHIFQDIFVRGLDGLDPCKELTEADIRTAIRNSGGVKGSLLIPEVPFELLVKAAIKRLLAPSLQCNQFVYEELLRIAGQAQVAEASRFPRLQRVLEDTVMDFITAGSGPAEKMIRDLVECELAHINTAHPAFIGGSQAVAMVVERRRGGGSQQQGSIRSHPLTPRQQQQQANRLANGPGYYGIAPVGDCEEDPAALDPAELMLQAQAAQSGEWAASWAATGRFRLLC